MINESIQELRSVFNSLIHFCEEVPTALFYEKKDAARWSIAENVHHLSLTYMPVNTALRRPAIMERRWGVSGRVSRSQEIFIRDYDRVTTDTDWKTFPPFVPLSIEQSEDYIDLHASQSKEKIRVFYAQVGEQIQSLPRRSAFQKQQREDVLTVFKENSSLLLDQIVKLNDSEMDRYQVPLPYIGLITIQELVYFTRMHTEHHLQCIKRLANSVRA
ncbi:MAG: DinB family protein [Spirochaetia bacterium]|nr:DinB family protein [Spirochaetia bacterium]